MDNNIPCRPNILRDFIRAVLPPLFLQNEFQFMIGNNSMDNNINKRIYELGLLPVIVIDDAKDSLDLAKALIDGGLPAAEVTLRTDAGLPAIKLISEKYKDMLVGAGTVLKIDQVDAAIENGAKFIVSPGFDEKIVKYCVDKNIPVFPGVSNASELAKAASLGLEVVKFFPAEDLGGMKMINALGSAYTNIKFMPTGGINSENLTQYLKSPRVLACGGSFMVKKDLIKNHQYEKITALTKEAMSKLHNFNVVHIGINNNSKEDADKGGDILHNLFGFEKDVKPMSTFLSGQIELMNGNKRGQCGHIAIGCNNIDRAMAYLKTKGVTFDESTLAYNDAGQKRLIYINGDINGFAYHLALNK